MKHHFLYEFLGGNSFIRWFQELFAISRECTCDPLRTSSLGWARRSCILDSYPLYLPYTRHESWKGLRKGVESVQHGDRRRETLQGVEKTAWWAKTYTYIYISKRYEAEVKKRKWKCLWELTRVLPLEGFFFFFFTFFGSITSSQVCRTLSMRLSTGNPYFFLQLFLFFLLVQKSKTNGGRLLIDNIVWVVNFSWI
jgi:hypothetical protein